jgi:HSP20 family protein
MTTLVRWAPFQDFDVIERRMRRMLEDFGVAPAPLPAADLYETEKELIVELDVPGFDEEQLALEVSDHTLIVRGERVKAKEEKD